MPKVRKSFRNRLETTLKTINSPTVSVGFSHIDIWADLGNLALNRMMSGRFDRGLLFGRNYVIYGESGSGKSLEAAYIASNCQRDHNAWVVWIDVEKATDDEAGKKWLRNAGVDLDRTTYMVAATLGDVKAEISKMTGLARDMRKEKEAAQKVLAEADAGKVKLKDKERQELEEVESFPPLVVIVDSWAAAMTESQYDQAVKGEMKGDQGQKAKQTGDVILATTHLTHGLPIIVIGVQHVMDNQERHPQTGRVIGRRHKTTGGNKQIFFASGCLLFTKKELKDEDVENEEAQIHYKQLSDGMTAELKKKKRTVGITCVAEALKSRVSKPFERVDIQIPYVIGMDRYSGLFDWLMLEGTVYTTSPGWYAYRLKDGTEKKFQKAKFDQHRDIIIANAPEDLSEKYEEPEDGTDTERKNGGEAEGGEEVGADAKA